LIISVDYRYGYGITVNACHITWISLNSFGKIIIETKTSDVDIEAYKQHQAQQRVVSIPLGSVNDVILKVKQRIKTGLRNVTGCCILSNGKMVFMEC
jgi:hypothetical protein